MAASRRDHPGGIEGLLTLLTEHGEAISADLITMRRSIHDLGTPALPWVDLLAIVRHLPPTSALGRVMAAEHREEDGDEQWDLHAHLLAGIWDALNALVWLNSGGKRKDRPKPIPSPGRRPTRYGHVSMTLDQAAAYMQARRQGRSRPT